MIAARLGYKEIFRKITVQKFAITKILTCNSILNTSITNTSESKMIVLDFRGVAHKTQIVAKNFLNLQFDNFIPGCKCDRLWVFSSFPH